MLHLKLIHIYIHSYLNNDAILRRFSEQIRPESNRGISALKVENRKLANYLTLIIVASLWQTQDFPCGGGPIPKSAIILQFFWVENCMKMKEFGPPRGGGRASLMPPWIRHALYRLSKENVKDSVINEPFTPLWCSDPSV